MTRTRAQRIQLLLCLTGLALGPGCSIAGRAGNGGPPADTQEIRCDNCAQWNADHAPFRVYGNTYYVGTEGLSSVLITTQRGHFLLDGALPQSAPRIAAHIRMLGFRVEDVRWIVNSHAHYDHAGGIAALRRMSGAKVAASTAGASAMRAGTAPADDPQAGFGAAMRFPPVPQVSEVKDGASLQVGEVQLTARYTPGHTPGSTTWTWRSCEAGRCLDMVYADSLNPVSAPGFRYSAGGDARVLVFRRSIERVRDLPCDVLITAHPGFSALFERQDVQRHDPARHSLVDSAACKAYADDASKRLDLRLAEEKQATE